jgi:ATP/maltotriose-dependent transcriptional regulator MalT
LSWHHTDAAAAIDRAAQVEALATEVGDNDALMLSQAIHAVLLHRAGRLADAAAVRAAALTSAASRGSWEAGYVQLMAGIVDVVAGDLAAAVTHGTGALERFRPVGDPWAVAHTLGLLGAAERRLGHPHRARGLLDEARELMAGAQASRGAVDVLLELGALAIERDDLDDAEQHLREAVDVAQTIGPRSRAAALHALADLALARGDPTAATELHDRAEALASQHHRREVIISQVRDDIGAES